MPRRANDRKDVLERRLARAKAKREAKARERKATLENIELRREETIRTRMVERAGFSRAEWEPIVAVFARHYTGRFAPRPEPDAAAVRRAAVAKRKR